jgi:Secretion system C-terminal sorting domain
MYPGMPACMFQMNHPGFFSGPDMGRECPAPPVTEVDCSFLVTQATLSGGVYVLCVQANDQAASQSWEVIQASPGTTVYGSDPNECWTFTGGASTFTIVHYVQEGEGYDTCFLRLEILPDSLCQDSVVSASVENCDLEATINVNIASIATPYVITFGDGSLAVQSSSGMLTHTYSEPDTYDICLSYWADANQTQYITCCYPLEVKGCICPEDVIYVSSVEPCTWTATMLFALNSEYLPISVDFGDGTNGVFNSLWITHDFPDPGVYNVCYTYEVFPGDTLTCCELVTIPGCCLDPGFSLTQLALELSPSCYNPLYRISDVACQGGIVETTHLWEFSDSMVYEGPNPPDHLFTNFVNDTGWVCVTHTIICCEDTASYTACAPHTVGAYLGTPDEELYLSQTLPSTNQTVLQFIQQNASDPSLPLTIDGTLVVDIFGYFYAGTWNMGKDAEILVQGNLSGPYMNFWLSAVTIRSAFRLNGNSDCCRWKGIRSEGLTYIRMVNSWLMDANYAIRYTTKGGVAAGSPYPKIYSINNHYVNNYYGIKSEGQYVVFSDYRDNEMEGAALNPQVCGCNAVNAFDFSNAGPLLTVKIVPSYFQDYNNTIFNYEQAFHFSNTNLYVRGFNIDSLRDYADVPWPVPNNPDGDGAIGIDYRWSKSGNSSLDMDYMHFSDFEELKASSVAVRDSIASGKHTLTAIAGDPLSSITTSNLAGGYDLTIGSNATLSGTIQGNDISTNGGSQYGFGITGNIQSSYNTLRVLSSRFNINSNSPNLMNGGIFLHSDNVMPQNYRILDDTVKVYLTEGAGIGITNAKGFVVKRNILTNSIDIPGIRLFQGGSGLVDCNNIQRKTNGITVVASSANQYGANYFLGNNHDMEFTGDAMGASRSRIWWNSFDYSFEESLFYNEDAVTGPQDHRKYNAWLLPHNGVEARHLGSGLDATKSRFWYPSGYDQGTVYHPESYPLELFMLAIQTGFDPFPYDFCQDPTGIPPVDSLSVPGDEWEALVADTSYWAALTAAEQTFMRQEIYGLLLEYPDWADSSASLSGFKASQAADFVGQSETLRHDWQALLQDISDYQAALEPTRAAVDSLSGLAQQWVEAMHADSTLQDSLSGLIGPVLTEGDSITKLLEQADSLFFGTVQDSADALLLQNAALDDSEWHYWCEKRYNEIALSWLAGTVPDSTATAGLRLIAGTCLSDGGRSVLGARGLCEVWLKEHYGEDGCQGIPEGRSARPGNEPPASSGLMVIPNPASDVVRIRLSAVAEPGERQVQVLTLSGQQVYAGAMPESGELTVPVRGWNEGMYVVRVIGGTVALSKTFIVQHR